MVSDEHVVETAQLMGKMIVEGYIKIDMKNGKMRLKTKGKSGGQSCDFREAFKDGFVSDLKGLTKFAGALMETESFKSYNEEEQDAVLLLVAHFLATEDDDIVETEPEQED